MAIISNNIEREFVIDKSGTKLTDPNPELTVDQVMNHYSAQYPELTTATVHGPEIGGDKVIFRFKTTIGTKG